MRLEELINKYYDQLNDNDFHIWNYISKNKKECDKLAIDQLAFKCNVSRTTILRFAQKLSLKGYSELKLYLKLENKEPKENMDQTEMVCATYNKVIESIKNKDCTEIFEKFDSARNIYIYGVGMVQASIKKELKRIFMTAGKILYDLSGYQESDISLNLANSQDLFIIISVSGENKFLIDFASQLQVRNIPILSITKLKENTLSQMSDYNLYISSVTFLETINEMSYESVTSYFILIEILFLKYVEYKNGKEE
ncbi:MurR/RpiR family transcriptional regulator [Terrisporobacter mayombei]|uniref:HTH-type transcriptional regulator GlvR n=1 Tax=Terrisporobacter mayombei TaxID=1541 RepID=A0ABY9PX20_9FIRM|nr:MurR/RpiR family transcriptional regulator [Terrisporobacter mayombei]MCC3868100.1 MurR/RpiR family transcriptional regulator [Terrisporobacter mayombei]WMT80240.1 HTH-type transcriptional regulator GlvR [Terrisporobacter mayombei]